MYKVQEKKFKEKNKSPVIPIQDNFDPLVFPFSLYSTYE